MPISYALILSILPLLSREYLYKRRGGDIIWNTPPNKLKECRWSNATQHQIRPWLYPARKAYHYKAQHKRNTSIFISRIIAKKGTRQCKRVSCSKAIDNLIKTNNETQYKKQNRLNTKLGSSQKAKAFMHTASNTKDTEDSLRDRKNFTFYLSQSLWLQIEPFLGWFVFFGGGDKGAKHKMRKVHRFFNNNF